MEVTVAKETFECWEHYGHIVARSKGSSGLVIEVPVDCVTTNGHVIPRLVGEYIRNIIINKD
jgi:hypothetical protein